MQMKLILSLVLSVATLSLWAQPLHTTFIPASQIGPKPAATGGQQRGTSTFEVSYHEMEDNYSDSHSYNFGYFGWPLNRTYAVTANPINATDNETIRWGAVVFDSINNLATGVGYPLQSITSLRVDSIYFLYNHQNVTGQANKIIVSIYTKAATTSGITFTNSTNMDFSNTLLWKDSIVTTTSLTANGTNLYYRGMATGGVVIPQGQGYVVRIDYTGSKSDVFQIADGNRLECGSSGAASPSVVLDNTFRYYVGLTSTTPPATDLSGTGNLTYPSLPANCNKFYFQNLAISTVVTVDAPLAASATTSSAIGCPGQSVTLNAAVSGGSGSYSYTWSGNGTFGSPNSASTSVTLPNTNGVVTYAVRIVDNIENTTVTRTVNVTVRSITVDLGSAATLNCGVSQTLTPVVSGFTNGLTYAWSTAATTQSISVSNAGTYRVTVTNSAGCTATASKTYTSNANQSVSFTATTSYNGGPTVPLDQNRVCQNNTVNFTNTSTNTSGAWDFEWDYGDFSGGYSVNGSHAYLYPGNYVVTLTAENASGCIITSTLQVQVLPTSHVLCQSTGCPGAPIGINEIRPGPSSISCISRGVSYTQQVQFEVLDEIYGNPVQYIQIDSITNLPCGITYTLDDASGAYNEGSTGCITLSGTTTDPVGFYNVRVHVEVYFYFGSPPISGYLDMWDSGYDYFVRVRNSSAAACPPAYSFQTSSCPTARPLQVAGTSYGICRGNNVTLAPTITGGTAPLNYNWSPSTGLSCTNCRNPLASPISTTTYTLTVSDANSSAFGQVVVDVTPNVPVSISISVPQSRLCNNLANTINASVVNGGPNDYLILVKNGQTYDYLSSNSYPASAFEFNIGDELYVELSSSNPCLTSIVRSNSIFVSSCSSNNLSLFLTANDTVCAGDAKQLAVQGDGGTGNYTYSWTPTTALSCTNCANPIATPQTKTTYTVVVNDGQNSVTGIVTITPITVTIDAGNDITICGGGTATLNGISQPYNVIYWDNANALSCTNCTNPVASPQVSTTYYVHAYYAGANVSCVAQDSVTVNVASSAAASVTIIPSPAACVGAGAITFTALPINGGNASYQWKLNGSNTGSNSPSLTLNGLVANDVVSTIMTSSLSCVTNPTVTSNNITVSTCVGIGEVASLLQFKVQPNPSNGVFYINTGVAAAETWSITVFDLSGKEIMAQQNHGASLQQFPVDLSDKGKGVYILRLSNGSTAGYQRLVVY